MRSMMMMTMTLMLFFAAPTVIHARQDQHPLEKYHAKYSVRKNTRGVKPVIRVKITLEEGKSWANLLMCMKGYCSIQQWLLISKPPEPVTVIADVVTLNKVMIVAQIAKNEFVAEAQEVKDYPGTEIMGECGWRQAMTSGAFELLEMNLRPGMTRQDVEYLMGKPQRKKGENVSEYEMDASLHVHLVFTVTYEDGIVKSSRMTRKTIHPMSNKRSDKKLSVKTEVLPDGFISQELQTFTFNGKRHSVRIYEQVKTGLEFVRIPGGTLTQKSPKSGPDRKITVKPFLLCRTECTQKAWDKVGGKDMRQWKGENLPIDRVDWEGAREWCDQAGLRLPTEAEWAFASLGGYTSTHYFDGTRSKLEDHAWYKDNSEGRSHPVGAKGLNPYGLYDMYGNLWEWCEDAWCEDLGKLPEDGSPFRDPAATKRSARGGSWESVALYCNSDMRNAFRSGLNDSSVGFRPAVSLR